MWSDQALARQGLVAVNRIHVLFVASHVTPRQCERTQFVLTPDVPVLQRWGASPKSES